MKTIISYTTILLLFISCNGQQNNKKEKIDASKVKEITITNKIDFSMHKLKSNSIIVKEVDQIKKIVDAFSYSEEIKQRVNTGAGYGFFEIDFNEGEKNHYYTINYTVYDGVILRNDNNGDMFKNDRLEGAVYPLFVEK